MKKIDAVAIVNEDSDMANMEAARVGRALVKRIKMMREIEKEISVAKKATAALNRLGISTKSVAQRLLVLRQDLEHSDAIRFQLEGLYTAAVRQRNERHAVAEALNSLED